MVFGGGALLAALTIDLVGAALERGHFNTLAIGAVCGGLLFVALNLLVNDFGGFVRKTSTTFYHLRRQEHRQLKRVMDQVTRTELFQALEDADCKVLAASARSQDYPRGSVIFEAADPADAAYILVSGTVEIYDAADCSRPLARLGPNEIFGWYSTLTGAPTSDTAVATSDASVWVIPRESLDGLQRASNALELRQPMPAVASLSLSQAQHGGAPLAIFLGITLDGIPESLVIGSSMLHAAISVSLIVGLFLSNYPEALSSSVGMRQQGMSFGRILSMWSGLMLITGIGAAAGSVFFAGADPHVFAFVQGLAAGAMLTMIAETMLPEAYLKGGNVVGLSTLAGFLIAIFSKTLEPADAARHGQIAPPLEQEVPALSLQERHAERLRVAGREVRQQPERSRD
ncbi:hypothetical protein CCR95_23710 [Thiocystis minor]|uniref:cyclic nucleotide-binding domain-containing protein n=1 Tax=Thiocystis minor TaxID=61597 RepID=UPI001F5C971E|nr:cyclic nucleotide-binding domain-containing protein [Thiocystis minor]MBK5966992.1 hypothetical protein [Thiocystis minor]